MVAVTASLDECIPLHCPRLIQSSREDCKYDDGNGIADAPGERLHLNLRYLAATSCEIKTGAKDAAVNVRSSSGRTQRGGLELMPCCGSGGWAKTVYGV